MRILWVKTELLHPIDKGGRIRTYQMLRALLRTHQITYLCLDDGQAAPDAAVRAAEYCTELVTVPFRPARKGTAEFALDLLCNFLSPLPYAVARYRSRAQRAAVTHHGASADLVVCDFLTPSQNIPRRLHAPAILFEHNVEAKIWERRATIARGIMERAYMRIQWHRMKRFEQTECRRFDHVVAVSEYDARTIAAEYGISSVSSVSTGVDLNYFTPVSQPREAAEIVFIGSMDWMPNDDGIRWFIAEVLGRIRARIPSAVLTVVGRSPSAGLRRHSEQVAGIRLTGTVSDVRPYLARAAINVVPLRIGGGTRLKIYEAMAMGIPVVSTSIGAEGLPVRDGEHLRIADAPEDQAETIVRLLVDRERANQLAAQALQFVRAHCSWEAVAREFISQCLSVRQAQLSTSARHHGPS